MPILQPTIHTKITLRYPDGGCAHYISPRHMSAATIASGYYLVFSDIDGSEHIVNTDKIVHITFTPFNAEVGLT